MTVSDDVRALTLPAATARLAGHGISFRVRRTEAPQSILSGEDQHDQLRVLAQRRESDGGVTLVVAPPMAGTPGL